MTLTKFIPISFLLFNLALSCFAQDVTCILKGEVIDRDSKELLLVKATEDARKSDQKIPIVDGYFEYKLTVKHPEAYQLIFVDEHQNGAWRPITFFTDQEEITFTLFPTDQFDKNVVLGGEVNHAYHNFENRLTEMFDTKYAPLQAEMEDLRQKGEYLSEPAKKIMDSLQTASEGDKMALFAQLEKLKEDHNDKSAKGKALALSADSLGMEYWNEKERFIETNSSILAYYMLYQMTLRLEQLVFDEDRLWKNYQRLAQAHPDHPYGKMVGELLQSHSAIRVGEKAVEIEAEDLLGNTVNPLENLIGKVVLLDLWASWCGPCIKKSRTMIPIFNKYSDQGFSVLGIAREFHDTNKLKKALERENFPWENLVELDDKNDIWLKYNIPFSGGGIFLIDQSGKIIAINPTAEEVEKHLKQLL